MLTSDIIRSQLLKKKSRAYNYAQSISSEMDALRKQLATLNELLESAKDDYRKADILLCENEVITISHRQTRARIRKESSVRVTGIITKKMAEEVLRRIKEAEKKS